MPDGSVKLGFRAHYPQLETKLTVRGSRHGRHPAQARAGRAGGAHARLGNFILAEDDQTLEGVVLGALSARNATPRRGRDVHRRPDRRAPGAPAGRGGRVPPGRRLPRPRPGLGRRRPGRRGAGPRRRRASAETVARGGAAADRRHARARGADRPRRGRRSHRLRRHDLPRASPPRRATASRRSRILGGREWVRLGAVELALDCLRRHLQGLPVDERIDFEKK